MSLIIKPKTKKQEQAIKAILRNMDIDFVTVAKESAAEYKTSPKETLTKKEKKILDNLEQSVEFVNKFKKGITV
jgi:hypothetical protein